MAKEVEEVVVGKRKAPVCMVVMQCGTCKGVKNVNAYLGPAICGCVANLGSQPFMTPVRLTANPTVEVDF